MTRDRHAIAAEYDAQRERVMRARWGTASHRTKLRRLWALARELHEAERAEGVPVGSTREGTSRIA